MKRLKLYLDTSVISYLDQQDAPEKMNDTHELWKDIKIGKYDVVVSDVTLYEIAKSPEPKHTLFLSMLNEIQYHNVDQTDEAKRLCNLYFEVGGLPPKSKNDAMHIAIATVSECNVILSWNFKHIVNIRAMTAVDAVNLKEGYRQLRILSPTMLLEREE
ncbi:MAG: PIN domain-containing protein [Oscillospiraceae bacterium]|nr:PIN domain-containing protein [Oscillospiraceae bacterium]